MAVLAMDDFNRSNNTDLGTNWDVQTGQVRLGIVSNAAQNSDDSNDQAEQYNAVVWPNDQYSQAALTAVGSYTNSDGPCVAVRMSTSANTLYRACVNANGSGNLVVAKFVAGAYTQLASRTATYGAGQVLYLEARGTTLIVKYNGAVVGASISDSAISSGRAGLAYSAEGTGRTSQLDDWAGGDFSEPEHQTRRNEIRQLLAQ